MIDSWEGQEMFSSQGRSDRLWDQPKLLFNVHRRVPFLGVKWPRREAGHLPLSQAKGRNEWVCIFTPLYVFMIGREETLPFNVP
jgi:hypothetical protein